MKSVNEELKVILSSIREFIELEKLSGQSDFILKKDSPLSGISEKPHIKNDTPLEELKKNVQVCTSCSLSKTRRNVVFGSGSPKADLMFVGEAPGMEEDLQGLPFVGRAGKLLTKIIESIGLKRKDVYIANILKCRPPENRNPLPTEILTCENYLLKQIKLIKPKVICTLGKFASQTLLRDQTSISRLRGKFYDYRNAKLMPTFHPAYLLRNPGDKRLVWEDMKKIRKALSHDAQKK